MTSGRAPMLLVALTFPTAMTWLYFTQAGPYAKSLYSAGKIVQFGLPVLWWSAFVALTGAAGILFPRKEWVLAGVDTRRRPRRALGRPAVLAADGCRDWHDFEWLIAERMDGRRPFDEVALWARERLGIAPSASDLEEYARKPIVPSEIGRDTRSTKIACEQNYC